MREHARNELDEAAKLHDGLAKERFRETAKLFTRNDLRVASKVSDETLAEWRKGSLEAGPESARIDAVKAAARRKLDRRMNRELEGFGKARTLRRAELKQHGKIAATTFGSAAVRFPAHIDLGDITGTLTNATEFVPPFTSFDVQTIDPDGFVVRDDSFAKPEIGHLVNNFDYDQNESTSFSDGLWGLLKHAGTSNWAACGVPFTTSSEGRLEVSAVLRNFYNRIIFGVTDKFGFSSANVDIFVRLFVAVVRGTQVIFLPTEIRHTGLVSHGSEFTFSSSDIDDTTPFTVSATTGQRFNLNESVLVLAGSNVVVATVLDDMHCKVNAVLWWGLQKLAIGTAEDIFT